MNSTQILAVTFFLSGVLLSAQSQTNLPFQQVNLKSLPQMLEGNWEYDYSFNADSTFHFEGEYLQAHYVPFRMDFRKTTRRKNRKILKNSAWLAIYRNTSCLSEYEFFVDYKGTMRYPKLISSEVDSNGNLVECKLELAKEFYEESRDFVTVVSLSKGILIISNYQGDKRADLHVFVRE